MDLSRCNYGKTMKYEVLCIKTLHDEFLHVACYEWVSFCHWPIDYSYSNFTLAFIVRLATELKTTMKDIFYSRAPNP